MGNIPAFRENYRTGLEGLLYGTDNKDIDGLHILESASAEFGYLLVYGTDPETQVALPNAGTVVGDVAGILLNSANKEVEFPHVDGQIVNYTQYQQTPFGRKCKAKLTPADAVTKGGPIYYQIVTNAGVNAGQVRGTADGVNAIDISSIASWFIGADPAAGEYAVIELFIKA